MPSDIIASLWDAIRSNNFDRLSTAVDDLLLGTLVWPSLALPSCTPTPLSCTFFINSSHPPKPPAEGYAAPLVLNQLHDDLVVMEGLSDATKVNLLIHSLFTAI